MNLALKLDKHYTYAEYLTWNTDDRYELIDGASYLMSPAPSISHQAVVAEIFNQIYTLAERNKNIQPVCRQADRPARPYGAVVCGSFLPRGFGIRVNLSG